jgi:para-aminobenzoate synthetase component 1
MESGWVGFLSYDLGRFFETLPTRCTDDLHWPLFDFTYHDVLVAHDNLDNRSYLITPDNARAPYNPACTCGASESTAAPATPLPSPQPVSNFSRAAYEAAVARVIDYITAGDVFQVNLSQRFSAPLPVSPAQIYQRLQQQAPAFFGALLDYGNYALISNSPELFFCITPTPQGRVVLTRPIKGTRPRKAGMERQLRDSPKDQAELFMIVDLERNDLGRVCRIGSVKVSEQRTIETHPTVYHGAAGIEGVLCDDVGMVDLLRAIFPGGSVTGAPKIRAMQIIEELEPTRRGPYCGAIGYLSVDGHVAFNLAIRTMLARDGRIHIPVGGGIVADSVPSEEYDETLVKARAMFDALHLI